MMTIERINTGIQAVSTTKMMPDGSLLKLMLKASRMQQHFPKTESLFEENHLNEVPSLVEKMPEQSNAMSSSMHTSTPLINLKPHSSGVMTDFVSSLWSIAKQAVAMTGLDPKLLIAQAALETGWGRFIVKDANGVSSNNLFNIKASAQTIDAMSARTTEYIENIPVKTTAAFQQYNSFLDSFCDYVALIQNSTRYQEALAHAGNPERYLAELSKAGYATDPNYSSKVLSIYYGPVLNQTI